MSETSSVRSIEVQGADAGVQVQVEDAVSTRLSGIDYSAQLNSVTVHARFGRFVIVAGLSSYCCDTGYADAAGRYVANLDDFRPLLDRIAARVAVLLDDRGLV